MGEDDTTKKPEKRYTTTLHNSDVNNPCLKEQMMSYKCLDANNFVPDKCQAHFLNYKKCREFWGAVSRHRRKHNISPYLPPPEERDAIKQKYFATGSLSP